MHIYFGLEFDDLVFPRIHDLNEATLGTQYCGANKFLLVLETHFGLTGTPSNNEYLRIEQYRQALQKHLVDKPNAFYAASFDADTLATAAALLSRRDELILAEWDFKSADKETPERLKTLAEIEDIIFPKDKERQLSLGFADRFAAVVKAIGQYKHPITHISLNEPLNILPFHFQRLFHELQEQGVILNELTTKSVKGDSDLIRFRQSLMNRGQGKVDKLHLKGDGSLLIMCAKRETDAAAYLAKLLQKNKQFRPVCLIPEKNRVLDNAFIQEGLPSLGILSESLARPSLQILKLVSAFVWKPIDPFKIMEFVSLTVKPLRDDLANIIAQEIAQTPGIKGARWNALIARYFEELKVRAVTDSRIDIEETRRQYLFWFGRKRYEIDKTVPKDDVLEIFQYVTGWATRCFDESGGRQQSFLVLSEQAKRICELLITIPDDEGELTNLQLERIVRTIYEPSPVTFSETEVGHMEYVHHSSAFSQDLPDLLWWNFIRNEPDYFFARWYNKEMNYLEAKGISVESPKRDNERLLWQRPRPIMRTKRRILLVIPEMVEGTGVQPHPLFSDMEASFDNVHDICFNIDTKEGQTALADLMLPEKIEIETRRLGLPKPFLKIKQKEMLQTREEETFSSLDSLFYYPYKWVFQYKIGLRKSSILSVVKDHTLMGNLAHSLFEDMFKEDILTWKKQDVEEWINQQIGPLLEREGAVLLMYGREPEKIGFINKLKFSAWTLIRMIQTNGWKVKGTEISLEGKFRGIAVKGKADLVLEKGNGELVVIDLKWRGAAFRQRIIKNEEDLQLVMYSKLLTADETWAHTAYFIMEQAKMIARNNLAFTDVVEVMPDSDHLEINERIWKKMEATYEWRMGQLKEGKIEIRTEMTLEDLEEDMNASMDLNELMKLLEMRTVNASYDDFKTLINLIE